MKRQAEGRVKTSPLQVRGESQKKKDITNVNPTTKPEKSQNAWDYYREKGFSVFPVDENKRPVASLLPRDEKGKPVWKPFQTRHATDAEFDKFKKSNSNIAIVTGSPSGIRVIDCDSDEARRELERLNPDGIKMPTVNTPRGGRHYYGRDNPSSWKNLQGFGKSKKIDLKTEGGYVLAPPSVTKDGRYDWATEQDLDKIPPVTMFPKRWEYLLLHARLSSEIGRAEEPGPRLVEGSRDVDIFRMACAMRREGWTREQAEELAVTMAEKARLKPHTHDFTNQDALDKVDSAWSRPLRDKYRGGEEIDSSVPMVLNLEDVPEEEVGWLWKNYIPLEEITLINGDPDAGKGWLALDWACRLSRGLEWADGAPGGEVGNTFYMTYEDSATKTLKKRIRWMGGDETHIKALQSRYPLIVELGTEEGRERVENAIAGIGNVRLWVIDPILDFTGSMDPNAAQMIRPLLTPIIKIAQRQHLSVGIIGHLNKDQAKALMYRAGGSTGAWMGKARAAFIVAVDKEDNTANPARYVHPLKNNYAWPRPVQMEFTIIDNKPVFQTSDVDMNEVLSSQRGRPPLRSVSALRWLETLFGERREAPVSEIETRRERDKPCGRRTLETVKTAAGYTSGRAGDGTRVWKKPDEN